MITKDEVLNCMVKIGIDLGKTAEVMECYCALYILSVTYNMYNQQGNPSDYILNGKYIIKCRKNGIHLELYDKDRQAIDDLVRSFLSKTNVNVIDNPAIFVQSYLYDKILNVAEIFDARDSVEVTEAKMFAILYFCSIEENYSRDNYIPSASEYYDGTIKNVPDIEFVRILGKDEFLRCWDLCISYKMKTKRVQVSGNMKTIIDMYRKNFATGQRILSDYRLIKLHPSKKALLNPYLYYYKGVADNNNIESGISIEEDLFNAAYPKIKEFDATEVIKSVFYNKQRNDQGFECSILFNYFFSGINSGSKILIINPSPDFLLTFYGSDYKRYKVSFAVPDNAVAELYNDQFSDHGKNKQSFFPFDSLTKSTTIYNKVLLMMRDLPGKIYMDLIEASARLEEEGTMIAVIPNILLEREKKKKVRKIFSNRNCHLERLTILPTSMTKTNPTKKVIAKVVCKNSCPANYETEIGEIISIKNAKETRARIHTDFKRIQENIFFDRKTTIKVLYNQLIDPKKQCEPKNIIPRAASKECHFSKEITMNYTVSKDKLGYYAGKAYFADIKYDSNLKGLIKGKRVTPILSKGLRSKIAEDIPNQVKSLVFDDRIQPEITSRFRKLGTKALETMTLKTLWFVFQSMINENGYDKEIVKELLCSEIKELENIVPYVSGETEYVDAMEKFFDSKGIATIGKFKYWKQINIIIKNLKGLGLLKYNPIVEIVEKASNRASKEQRDVRNALVKKSFSRSEEINIIQEMLSDDAAVIISKKGMEYYLKSLAVLIRLFTGAVPKELCGLTWGTFKKVVNLEGYQFIIENFVDDKGKAYMETDKKYRRVPVAPLLGRALLSCKDYIKSTYSPSDSELKDLPILFKVKGVVTGIDNCKPYRPRDISTYCKKTIDSLNFKRMVLELPEKNGINETDLNKYEGDIFVSNFKYYARNLCGFTQGETNYVLGLEAPDTFSKHYCDYSNNYIQYNMIKKLSRWDSVFRVGTDRIKEANIKDVKTNYNYTLTTYAGSIPTIDMVVSTLGGNVEGEVEVDICCSHGVKGSAKKYGK